MNNVLLLRHAKSSHGARDITDFDRPLAPRGKKDAARMGRFLKKLDLKPRKVISSPARRARQTVEIFLEAGVGRLPITWNDEFYNGTADDYLTALHAANKSNQAVLLVGHNPAIERAASRICGNGSVHMPAGALVCLRYAGEESDSWLSWIMLPGLLKKIGLE